MQICINSFRKRQKDWLHKIRYRSELVTTQMNFTEVTSIHSNIIILPAVEKMSISNFVSNHIEHTSKFFLLNKSKFEK